MRHFPVRTEAAAMLIAAWATLAFAQAPTPLSPAPATQAEPAAPTERNEGITAATLGSVDPFSAGLLDPDAGGLSANLWAGSDKATIQSLLPMMPVAMGGAAADDLARRLLLTRAQAPEGSASPGDSLLAIKLARLMAQGELDALTALQPNLGTLANDSKAARILAEADLLQDKEDPALALCETQLKTSSDPFWLKLSAFLHTQSGDAARAELALSMARDADSADPNFFQLMDSINRKTKLDAIKAPSILDLAILRALKQSPSREALQTHDTALLRYYSTLADLDPQARLSAAERLASMGLTDDETLSQFYEQTPLKDAERAQVLPAAERSPGTRARAILFQAARTASTPADQAAAVTGALTLAGDLGMSETFARLNRVIVQSLPPAPVMLPYAANLGRVMLLDADFPGAIKWYEGFRPLAEAGTKEAGDLALLDLLLTIGDPANARVLDPSELDIVLKTAQSWPIDQRPRRLSTLLSALDALGAKLPPSAWNSAIGATSRQSVDMAALRATREASEAGHIGETAILALILIGPNGPSACDPLALSEALLALVRVKLVPEARRIAVEAVIGHGL